MRERLTSPPVRVLLASTAGAGHVGPLLPFAAAARARGDEVVLAGPPSLEPAARAAGLPFHAGAEPEPRETAAIRERFAEAPPDEAARLINRELFGRLCTEAMLPAIERLVADWRPDLVLRDPCDFASALAAERAGLPHAQVAISLAAVEWSSLALAEPALAQFDPGLADVLRASAYLTRFPASLDPSPFPRTVRVREAATGAGGATDATSATAAGSPCRRDDADSALPLVYATLGSEAGRVVGGAAAHRTLASAFAGLPVRVLLTTGRDVDPAALDPLPPDVRAERWAPQAEAIAEAALVVCHGGSGTVLGALAAGVPLVMAPLFADQPRNARLVERAGAGLRVEGDRAAGAAAALASAEQIRAAVEQALADPRLRPAAARIAAELAAAPSVAEALARLIADQAGRMSPDAGAHA